MCNRTHFYSCVHGDLYCGDSLAVLKSLPSEIVNCCVTSPPYFGLRDYGVDGQIGLEETPEAYVSKLVEVFREVRRVLRDDGTLWLNLGSSYASDDKTPNQSPLRQRVPSCGTHGKAPQDFQAADRACLDSCDELQDATHCHRESSVRNGQCAAQGEQQTAKTAQDNEYLGCVQSSRQIFQPSDHQSTTDEVLLNAPDALRPLDVALACQQETLTSQRDAPACAHKSACTCGTSQMLQPLAVHTMGKESFFSACRRSDCYGIGRCGYCFSSLTIASLNVKRKDEMNIPHLVAMALQADGWVLRQTIIWHKPNPMPESVKDRCTKAHEYVFLLSKSQKYYFDSDVMKEEATGREPGNKTHKHVENVSEQVANGNHLERTKLGLLQIHACETRNRRSVWNIATRPYKGAHFAVFPPKLVEPCILAGCPIGGVVMDPFFGSGTTGMVARKLRRKWIGIDINEKYCGMALDRIDTKSLSLVDML